MEVSQAADTVLSQMFFDGAEHYTALVGEPTWASSSTVPSVLRRHTRVWIPTHEPKNDLNSCFFLAISFRDANAAIAAPPCRSKGLQHPLETVTTVSYTFGGGWS